MLKRSGSIRALECDLWITALRLDVNNSANNPESLSDYQQDWAAVESEAEKHGVDLSKKEYMPAQWAICQQLQSLRLNNPAATEHLLQIHWKHLLQSGAATIDEKACLKYRAGDILEEYRNRKLPLPNIPNNPDVEEINMRVKKLGDEGVKQISAGKWSNLKTLNLCNRTVTQRTTRSGTEEPSSSRKQPGPV